jgi:hypothetical protein
MENKEVKTESKVKKVAPHYMSVNPPKKHLTVVRPNYSQTKKEWSTRVINEKGEQIKGFIDTKEKVLEEWKKLMKKYHGIEESKL